MYNINEDFDLRAMASIEESIALRLPALAFARPCGLVHSGAINCQVFSTSRGFLVSRV